MAMTIEWDIVSAAQVQETTQGYLVRRGAQVNGLSISCVDGQDPNVLINAQLASGGFSLGSVYPDPGEPTPRLNATLRDIQITSIDSATSARVVMTFFEPSALWNLDDNVQMRQILTNCTSAGTRNIQTWYNVNFAFDTVVAPPGPAGATPAAAPVPKLVPYRIFKATTTMSFAQYTVSGATWVAAAGALNSDNWGAATRGQWLFMGPVSRMVFNTDLYQSVNVELSFLYAKRGHYPIEVWKNAQGFHPTRSTTEAQLYAAGLPAVDNLVAMNGITRSSVSEEVPFTLTFPAFHPVP